MHKQYAILTSGGDSPGMNAVIRAFTRRALHDEIKVFGITGGYEGLLNADFNELKARDVGMVIQQGGTMLTTSRSERFTTLNSRKKLLQYSMTGKLTRCASLGVMARFAVWQPCLNSTKGN